MSGVKPESLYEWCSLPIEALENTLTKVPFRIVSDPDVMAVLMARELIDMVAANNDVGRTTRAILPAGPTRWYEHFVATVNRERVSLRNLHVFHMDEMLDWQGRPLPRKHPYNFRSFMETHFYSGVAAELAVPEDQRYWLLPSTAGSVADAIAKAPLDLVMGGWGQDGHVAYNQARRHPYNAVSAADVAGSSIRIQENNLDTIIALAQRTFGGAYQFVPPMSITLGMKECLAASRIRLYSDTGSWKQTAFRVALFSDPTPEYPITILQDHPDVMLIATVETARHALSLHPEWEVL